MEGHERGLESEAADEEGQHKNVRRLHRRGREPGGDVRHIQRSGEGIRECDAYEDKRGGYASKHHVLERRLKLLVLAPEAHERVRGNGRDLHEHEQIE